MDSQNIRLFSEKAHSGTLAMKFPWQLDGAGNDFLLSMGFNMHHMIQVASGKWIELAKRVLLRFLWIKRYLEKWSSAWNKVPRHFKTPADVPFRLHVHLPMMNRGFGKMQNSTNHSKIWQQF